MFRNLAKIANKLDSLGLTKEADVIDRYLEKTAGQFDVKSPPPQWAQDLFKRWLDTSSWMNKRYTFDSGGEIASFIPTSSVDVARTVYGQILGLCAFVEKELNRDGGGNLYLWYYDNIHSYTPILDVGQDASKFLGDDFISLASKFEDVAKSTPNLPELQRLYREAASKLKSTGELWKQTKDSYDPQQPEIITPSAPKASEQGITMTETTSYPPKAAPAKDPWAKVSKELKKAWLDRAAARKKDPSYTNYQAWLRSKDLVGATEDMIKATLRMDVMTGGQKKNYEFTEAKAPEITPGSGFSAVDRQRGK